MSNLNNILPADHDEYTSFIQAEQNNSTKRRKIQQIEYFYAWLAKDSPQITTILDVPPVKFRQYFGHIETQIAAQLGIKRKYKNVLKQLITWIVSPKMACGEEIKYNYTIVFDPSFSKLSDTGTTRHEEPLTKKDVVDCIQFFRTRNERDYMIVCLLAYTGMRIGGACNIAFTSIDFQNRCIETKEKRTKANTGDNRYAFPKFFVEPLKAYILQLQTYKPNQTLLFPVTTKNIRKQLKKWRKTIHPHLFRDALNSRWAELRMDDGIRSILLNQKPVGVNAQHYLKELKSWIKRLEYYDQYFPY